MSFGKGQNQVIHVDRRAINSAVSEKKLFDNQDLIVKLSNATVSVKKGVFSIGAELTRNNQPVQLIEGKHTSIVFRPQTNSILFDFKEQGLIGGKEVNEIDIGDGKVLMYDSETDKLVYIDFNETVLAIINSLPKDEFIAKETPSGDVDGTNRIFSVENSIKIDTEQVFLNGMLLEQGIDNDYIIEDNNVVFNVAPRINWKIKVSYVTEVI